MLNVTLDNFPGRAVNKHKAFIYFAGVGDFVTPILLYKTRLSHRSTGEIGVSDHTWNC